MNQTAPHTPPDIQESAEELLAVAGPPRVRRRRRLPPSAIIAIGMLSVIVAIVVVVPFLPGFSPDEQSLSRSLTPPFTDPAHLLGTDTLGRDLLSRLAVALRVSLLIGLTAVAISFTIGMTVGLLAGFYRGRLDNVLMAAGDIQLSIPVLLLLIVLAATVGSSPLLLALVLGVMGWPPYGRLARSLAVSLREREYVQASRAVGASDTRVILRHLFPQIWGQLLTLAAYDLGIVIIAESSLSYLGLGIQPPTPSLGLMIGEAQRYLQTDAWFILVPGLAMFFVIAGAQFLSQGIVSRRR